MPLTFLPFESHDGGIVHINPDHIAVMVANKRTADDFSVTVIYHDGTPQQFVGQVSRRSYLRLTEST